ncbi:MAG: 4'-phosphopantetheinyl transferase superfamily protein [Crocinitomicaceae bacterium]|nr:4'-phosphopantetheinyl transferase superfamily protein [Crocinitomicaceae bacterium]
MSRNTITLYHLSLLDLYEELKARELNGFMVDDAFKNYQVINAVFVKSILEVYTKKEVATEELEVNAHGKPFLNPEIFNGLHFNKSNTKDHIVLAIAKFPLGIDLEPVRETFKESILKRIVHPEDHLKIESAAQFYQLWSIKEAFVKYIGTGLHVPLKEVMISRIDGDFIEVKSSEQKAEIRSVEVVKDHVCYVASSNAFSAKIEVVDHTISEQILIEQLRKSQEV